MPNKKIEKNNSSNLSEITDDKLEKVRKELSGMLEMDVAKLVLDLRSKQSQQKKQTEYHTMDHDLRDAQFIANVGSWSWDLIGNRSGGRRSFFDFFEQAFWASF